MTKLLTVGQLAAEVGVSVDTIKRAEADGRLPTPARDGIGRRVYDPADVPAIRRVFYPQSPAPVRTSVAG